MPNSESSSKTPISQEVENPSSFNFSVSPPEESPSTPVCGVGEMDESVILLADILASPIFHSENIVVCSPTLVLSGDNSQNLKAQSVEKHNVGLPSEEIDVGSMAVSSAMFERLFEGDLPEGKGPESCILTAGMELVAVQSLASLRGDVQPTFLEHEPESLDQVPHRSEPIFDQTPKSFDVGSDKKEKEEIPLKWNSRGR
ncbi:hypothetical protein H5410_016510 [Solanum commersonii]|uniref:Uncharacterized protein n=1 Tax=Solanum commersonii TaxID=4109 RepID=A0A9J5ZWK3_SOLCO|nr:hypothetical protein H5410_016510 [Solanum commersonii]